MNSVFLFFVKVGIFFKKWHQSWRFESNFLGQQHEKVKKEEKNCRRDIMLAYNSKCDSFIEKRKKKIFDYKSMNLSKYHKVLSC